METEHAFTCPYCWQTITMLLDLSTEGEQRYVEDCEVCCRPIEITFRAGERGELDHFDARPAQP